MQAHSASGKSVWYAFLMLDTLPSHRFKTPFRTVSPQLLTSFLDAKQKYDEERDEDRESASTSITVTH